METHLDMSDNCRWLWAITSAVMTTERGCQVLSFQLEMEKKKLPWALPVEIGRLKKPSRSKFAKHETCHLHEVAFHVKVAYANLYQSSTTYSIWRSLFKTNVTTSWLFTTYVIRSCLNILNSEGGSDSKAALLVPSGKESAASRQSENFFPSF